MTLPLPESEEHRLLRFTAAVRRELGKRKRLYPSWVEEREMTQAQADEGIAVMADLLAYLNERLEEAKAPRAPCGRRIG